MFTQSILKKENKNKKQKTKTKTKQNKTKQKNKNKTPKNNRKFASRISWVKNFPRSNLNGHPLVYYIECPANPTLGVI